MRLSDERVNMKLKTLLQEIELPGRNEDALSSARYFSLARRLKLAMAALKEAEARSSGGSLLRALREIEGSE